MHKVGNFGIKGFRKLSITINEDDPVGFGKKNLCIVGPSSATQSTLPH